MKIHIKRFMKIGTTMITGMTICAKRAATVIIYMKIETTIQFSPDTEKSKNNYNTALTSKKMKKLRAISSTSS